MKSLSTLLHVLAFTSLLFLMSCAGENERSEIAQKAYDDYDPLVIEAIETAEFKSINGEIFSIADFKGRVVILDFWETWCGPCIRSFPTLDKLANEYDDDFVVLAISPGFSDTEEDVKDFVAQNDYDFEWVFNEELAMKLRIEGIPFKVFLDANGHYIKTVMGSYPDDYEKIKDLIAANSKP